MERNKMGKRLMRLLDSLLWREMSKTVSGCYLGCLLGEKVISTGDVLTELRWGTVDRLWSWNHLGLPGLRGQRGQSKDRELVHDILM